MRGAAERIAQDTSLAVRGDLVAHEPEKSRSNVVDRGSAEVPGCSRCGDQDDSVQLMTPAAWRGRIVHHTVPDRGRRPDSLRWRKENARTIRPGGRPVEFFSGPNTLERRRSVVERDISELIDNR